VNQPPKLLQPEMLYENDDLKLSYLPAPAAGADLVVAFSGIGHRLGAIQTEEFVGSASRDSRAAVFVTDKRRSWFNAPGLYENVIEKVLPLAKGARRTLTLGNSMGGAGALLFAAPLGAVAALAFGPQASVSTRVIPEERRWRAFVSQIATMRFENINDYMQSSTRYYVMHGLVGRDRYQSAAFRSGDHLRQFIFADARHNFTKSIKKAGLLPALVNAAVDRDDRRFDEIMSQVGGQVVGEAAPTEAGASPVVSLAPPSEDRDRSRATRREERRAQKQLEKQNKKREKKRKGDRRKKLTDTESESENRRERRRRRETPNPLRLSHVSEDGGQAPASEGGSIAASLRRPRRPRYTQ
jgi:ribosomal protein L12E/L44/L45/RPP1/RPP2